MPSARAAQPRRVSEVRRWDREADVVVVGLGAAGACAAIEAARAGASVLALERGWRGGGTSAESTGQIYLGGGTPLQKACGFEDDPEEMAKYLVASCGPGADEEKIRRFSEGSVEHYHWLVACGIAFEMGCVPYEESTMPRPGKGLTWTGSERAHPFRELARPAPRGHNVTQNGVASGELLMQKLLAGVAAAGAAVQTDARAETLAVEDDGRVAGLVARVAGREECVRVRRGVVLASGGFVNDPEMLRRYAPDLLQTGRVIAAEGGDDGSGIRMGVGAGGAAVRMEAACIVLSFAYGNRDHIRGVLVNAQGQRYVNEDVYQSLHGEIALRRQGGQVWLVVDDSIYRPPELDAYAYLGLRVAAVAESPEELGRELGLPEGSLGHTLAVYNAHAARGEDPLFHKEGCWLRPLAKPPYAAIDLRVGHGPYPVFTLGGLWTLPTGEVRDVDGEVVPGLFAAGRTASGLPAQGYNSGLSLADATWSGRLAGRAAAVPVR